MIKKFQETRYKYEVQTNTKPYFESLDERNLESIKIIEKYDRLDKFFNQLKDYLTLNLRRDPESHVIDVNYESNLYGLFNGPIIFELKNKNMNKREIRKIIGKSIDEIRRDEARWLRAKYKPFYPKYRWSSDNNLVIDGELSEEEIEEKLKARENLQ